MPYYVVGTAKELIGQQLRMVSFTKDYFINHFNNIQNFRIFNSLDEARLYARSLHKQYSFNLGIASLVHIETRHAPLVHIEPKNENGIRSLNVKQEMENLNGDSNDEATKIHFISSSDTDFKLENFSFKAYEYPSAHCSIQYFPQATFFRGLNPASTNSGVMYCLAIDPHTNSSARRACQGREMLDYTVGEVIQRYFDSNLGFLSGMLATFHILVGGHYDLQLIGAYDDIKGGTKGALDYLIFPLVARKLIADTYLSERQESCLLNCLAWAVAIPLEILRFGAGIALTLLLAPIVAITTFVRSFQCQSEESLEDNAFSKFES
ncbi:MAG: hypothetical protein H0U73_10645 [Tatlockia sp.]|nr:hypothetical protein [Tatlockia sp.]